MGSWTPRVRTLQFPSGTDRMSLAGRLSPSNLRSQPRWLSGLKRSRVHSLMIARRSLCPEKLGSNPGQGSKGINCSGWHGLDMSITVTKRRETPTNLQKLADHWPSLLWSPCICQGGPWAPTRVSGALILRGPRG